MLRKYDFSQIVFKTKLEVHVQGNVLCTPSLIF